MNRPSFRRLLTSTCLLLIALLTAPAWAGKSSDSFHDGLGSRFDAQPKHQPHHDLRPGAFPPGSREATSWAETTHRG